MYVQYLYIFFYITCLNLFFKVLPLNTILESVLGRRYLSLFLENLCSQGLVGYWMAVEELRSSRRSNWHQLGAEIFYTYIRSPSAEIKVDKVSFYLFLIQFYI